MINDQHGNLYKTGKYHGKNILAISPVHPLVQTAMPLLSRPQDMIQLAFTFMVHAYSPINTAV
jgi:hypothetical protein